MTSLNFGEYSTSNSINSIAIGYKSNANNINSISLGSNNISDSNNSISIGVYSKSTNDNSISIGNNSNSNSINSISIGYKSNCSNNNTISIGDQSKSLGSNSISIGYYSLSSKNNSISIGDQSKCYSDNSISMGYHCNCNSKNSIVLGDQSKTLGDNSLSIGYNSLSNGNSSISIGNESISNNINSICIGNNARSFSDNIIKLGNSNHNFVLRNKIKINNYFPIPTNKSFVINNPKNGQICFNGDTLLIYIDSNWYYVNDNIYLIDKIINNNENNNQLGLTLHKSIKCYNNVDKLSGKDINIAVSDSGIYICHPELSNKIIELADYSNENFSYSSNSADHGTHVAGIIGANKNNFDVTHYIYKNMHGYAFNCKLFTIRVFDSNSNWIASDEDFLDMIEKCIKKNIRIVNCSWGISDWFADGYSSTGNIPIFANYYWYPNQINSYEIASNNNIIHVFSSGNEAYKESGVESSYPLLYPNFISTNITNIWVSVVSVSNNGKESYYTNRAGSLCQDWTITAHGGDFYDDGGVNSVNMSGGYFSLQGTSMASPSVSGGLALIMEKFPNLSSKQCLNILFLTATYDGLYIGTHLNEIDGLLDDYKSNPTNDLYNTIKLKILGNNYGNDQPNTEGGKRYDDGSGKLIEYPFFYYISSEKLIDCLGFKNAEFILKAIFGYGLMDLDAAVKFSNFNLLNSLSKNIIVSSKKYINYIENEFEKKKNIRKLL